jgi:hypothetical protein
MNDIVGSIWEDDERLVGNGRYFMILTSEPHPQDPRISCVIAMDVDRMTEETQQLDYDARWNCFPWLENLKRIM